MEVRNQSTARSGEIQRALNNKAGKKKRRDRIKAYFNDVDAVSWQYNATFVISRDYNQNI
jgi:hypothetical protein